MSANINYRRVDRPFYDRCKLYIFKSITVKKSPALHSHNLLILNRERHGAWYNSSNPRTSWSNCGSGSLLYGAEPFWHQICTRNKVTTSRFMAVPEWHFFVRGSSDFNFSAPCRSLMLDAIINAEFLNTINAIRICKKYAALVHDSRTSTVHQTGITFERFTLRSVHCRVCIKLFHTTFLHNGLDRWRHSTELYTKILTFESLFVEWWS